MKDIVENRQRVSLTEKTRLALLILKENGFVWCSAFAIYYLASSVSQRAFSVMDRLRREKGVPGMNIQMPGKHGLAMTRFLKGWTDRAVWHPSGLDEDVATVFCKAAA